MKNRANWIAFALLFIIAGIIWIGNAYSFQSDKSNYQENGVLAKGTIRSGEYVRIGKSRNYEVNVRYTTQSDKIVGQVIFANCKLINGSVFDQITQGMEVDVLYLSNSPAENTVLALSLEDENIEIMDRYIFGYIFLLIGLGCLGVSFALKKRN